MTKKKYFLLLLVAAFAAGCINTPAITSNGVLISMNANPPQIFTGAKTTIGIDIDNNNAKTILDVSADIFETGILSLQEANAVSKRTETLKDCFEAGGECGSAPCKSGSDLGACAGIGASYCCAKEPSCKKYIPEMKPDAFDMFSCEFWSPKEIGSQSVTTTLFARAKFKTSLFATQMLKIISQKEFDLRKKTGRPVEEPSSYSYRDDNLELSVDFSDSLPLIDAAGKKAYVSFALRNIGSGFIEKISKGDIKMTSPDGILSCPDIKDLFVSGTQFPRFACEISLPGGITFLSDRAINIDIAYSYEVRNSIDVEVRK